MDSEFRILERIMQGADQRHKVIASNIANTDTPGYKAKDVDFGGIIDEEQTRLLISNPKHIGNGKVDKFNGKLIVEDNLSWGDSNNVELDVEVARMTENALIHEAAVTIMAVKIRMFKSAIRGGR